MAGRATKHRAGDDDWMFRGPVGAHEFPSGKPAYFDRATVITRSGESEMKTYFRIQNQDAPLYYMPTAEFENAATQL
jgi:hypothetical protein